MILRTGGRRGEFGRWNAGSRRRTPELRPPETDPSDFMAHRSIKVENEGVVRARYKYLRADVMIDD
jgi:hypothetical protein